MKFWLIFIPIFVVASIAGLSVYLQPNDFIGCPAKPVVNDEKCGKADAIVVISGGDTDARTDGGIALYLNGWADTLVLSGAAQDKTGLSNAAAMQIRARAAGVPDYAILIDEFAETTAQNAQNSGSIFEEHGYKNVILVTSGYHQRRASLEFEKRANTSVIRNHPLLVDRDWNFGLWWVSGRGWWLAGGEFIKVIAFYIQGNNP